MSRLTEKELQRGFTNYEASADERLRDFYSARALGVRSGVLLAKKAIDESTLSDLSKEYVKSLIEKEYKKNEATQSN